MVKASVRQEIHYAPIQRRLPERLTPVWTIALLGADVFAVLAAAYIVMMPATTAPAACVIICGSLAICSAYRVSYAVHWRDEIYHVIVGCTLAALPLWAITHFVSGLPSFIPFLALLASAVFVAFLHVVFHLARHTREDTPYAGASRVSPEAQWNVQRPWFTVWKTGFDVALAALGLVVLSPLMLLAGLAVFAESGQPIFFRQERVGKNGTRFLIFKFRTMRQEAGSNWARPGDRRITRIGAFLRRYSIDELPQLLNVMRGDMSLVGPRPEMVEFARDFTHTLPHYDERHIVQPGITGWAQVQLERNLDPSDMPAVLPYDLFYVDRVSPALDSIIVLKTAVEFLFHRAV